MSHLHMPDGLIAPWLWIFGYAVVGAVLFAVFPALKREENLKRFPLLGAFSALMLLGMSLEIVPLAYHVNLAVIAGVVLGPALSILAAFIVNVTLAFFGHGGITVAGLNTLILAFEMVFGWLLLRFVFAGFPHPRFTGFFATVLTLALSTSLALSTVFLGVRHTEGVRFDALFFAEVSIALGSIGWVLEGVITASVLRSLGRLKPELVQKR